MHAGLTHSYLLIHPLMFSNAHYRPTASKHTYMPRQCTHFIRTPVQRQLSSFEQHKYRCRSFTHYTLIAQVESTHINSLLLRGILTPKSPHINVLILINPRTPEVGINFLRWVVFIQFWQLTLSIPISVQYQPSSFEWRKNANDISWIFRLLSFKPISFNGGNRLE